MRSVKRRVELLAWLGSRLGKPPGFERVVRPLAPPESCSGSLFVEFFRRHRYRLFAVGRNWWELIDARVWPANANIFASPMPAVKVPGRETSHAVLSLS